MRVHDHTIEFGWDGDAGLGDMLIGQIIEGEKTATCGFKAAYSANELEEVFGNKGTIITAVDRSGRPRCNVRITDVFETTFGDPDMRLVRGEGDGDDVAKFQRDHAIAWAASFGDAPLSAEEILIVEMFELVEIAND